MHLRTIAVGLAVLTLGACTSTPTVSTDETPGANLATYRTFSWASTQPVGGMNPVAFERMRMGVEGALTSKGYAKGDPGDLTVILTVGARDKTDINTWGRFGRQVDVYQYTEGRMAVDVFDTKTRQPLWHGQATQTITPSKMDPALIDAAVADVMAKFPARA
jgi:hypothetical protein